MQVLKGYPVSIHYAIFHHTILPVNFTGQPLEQVMCDDQTEKDNTAYFRKKGLTRREFNIGSASLALAMALPTVSNAMDVAEQEITIQTPDGMADCYFVHPVEGAHAAVIVWPDIMGIRTSFRMMGKRLAASGYSVLVVNPYYRTARGAVIADGESFSNPEVRARLMPLAQSLSPQTCVTDGRAFVAFQIGRASCRERV